MTRPVKLLLSVALAAGALSPQDSWLSTTPQQLALDVVALDSRGQPVADLTAADFTIEDESRPQRIAYFQRVGSHTRHSPSAAAFSNRPNIAGSQTALVILLDPTSQAASDTEAQMESISRALEHLDTPEDVYLYLLAAGGKLLPVRGLPNASQPLPIGVEDWPTQSRSLLKKAMIQADQLKPVADGDPALRAHAAFQALLRLCRDLRILPGPQNVLWISQGTPLHFKKPTGEHADLTDEVISLNYAFTYDQVAIHTVFEGDAGEQRENQLLLQMFAGLSGARAYSGHDLAAPIHDIMTSARGIYRIWYEPGRDNWNGRFHKVRVTCAREGVHIMAQQGYLAIPRDITEATLKRRFNLTAFAPSDTADIGLRAKVSVLPMMLCISR